MDTFRAGFGHMTPELVKGCWVFLVGNPGRRQVEYGEAKPKQVYKATKGT